MRDDTKMPRNQVDRIMAAISTAQATNPVQSVPVDLIERVVELEVEFQFVEDRQPILRRLRDLVNGYVEENTPSDGGLDAE